MSSHRLTTPDILDGYGHYCRRVGRRVRVFDELESTNSYALEQLCELGTLADGTVIFAEHQTKGRGRLGRRWHSPRGASLLFTVLLVEPRDTTAPRSPARLNLIAAVSVAQAIRNITGVEAVIHWPNDLYVENKKLAGILIETREWPNGLLATAMGIGINCLQQPGHFPPDLTRPATSLEIESLKPIDRAAVARDILWRLDCRLVNFSDQPPNPIIHEDVYKIWKLLSNDIGQRVTVVESGIEYTGRILDLDPADGLLLQLDTGARRAFYAHSTTRL